MTSPVVRLSRPGDINDVSALDLKCYPYPMAITEWKNYLSKSGHTSEPRVVVVEVHRKPVGFAMWHQLDDDVVQLMKLGVKPRFRRLGIGKLLAYTCLRNSNDRLVDRVRIIVPDIHCKPGDPDDVSEFLTGLEFSTTGDVVDNFQKMYGDWVDGYVFERSIINGSL